ncbi:hypothetical protein [Brevibacillus sp. NRS-1366]|uniref:hypothetical protein n=1 Tax=Brevibacillus sp. NRS-1366 TaxID=3233899 RepID=UPI003D22C53C
MITEKMVVNDVYLDNEKDNWDLVFVGNNDVAVTLEIPDATALCRLIHQLTHMLPMKRLKEEDKQELIFGIEQILPHIYRNHVLDEYVLE